MNLSFWRDRRVLITGHTGFKGSWLAAMMHQLGAKVLGIALPSTTEPNHFSLLKDHLRLESLLLNIKDQAPLRQAIEKFQPQIVFHLAAQSLVRESYRNPVETFATNIMGTVHTLEACSHVRELQAFVVVTSDKCYENHDSGVAFKENDRLGGFDPYSSSKACAELVTESMRNSFWQQSIEANKCGIATARAGNVIGGGDWSSERIVPDIIRACERKIAVKVRNPKSVRPWQHVLDPLSGYISLAEKISENPRSFSKAWNFGPAETSRMITVEEILNRARSILGDNLQWTSDPGPHPHEATTLTLDCRRAHTELQWSPVWDVERSIVETFRWYNAYLKAPRSAADMTFEQIAQFGVG
jgi:CDP-glucose 4,6-dehydratase